MCQCLGGFAWNVNPNTLQNNYFHLSKKTIKMTLKQLIKLENKAKEVWVVSPSLHYDTENKEFSELVSVNLGERTKYRYIVPATALVEKNMKLYKQIYKMTDAQMAENFLLLPPSEFNPFVQECAIYDAGTDCIACAAPALEDNHDVIRFSDATSKMMAREFRTIWKRYKRRNP